MCGLIGALGPSDERTALRIDAGLEILRHRGPNHKERKAFKLVGREVWLGHTRLSIIDLNDDANQPMCSEDGRYALVFNGEIYNYIELRDELREAGVLFHTTSDTEVLLKAWAKWGQNCLGRLDGMFAFVVLDTVEATLTCVRDPFGIKPFFYSIQNKNFYFASEVPAILSLLSSRPAADLQRAYDYLVHGDFDSSERTFLGGVLHLMPAHVMTLDVASGSIRSMRRWWTPKIEQTSRLSFKDAAEAVRQQFLQNIRRQLRSDVPLAAELSGGVDSSAIVCAMRHLDAYLPIHTFGFVAADSGISEEPWIDMINEHVNAVPHKVRVASDGLAHDIDDFIRSQGEPFGSTSAYGHYSLFKSVRESGITVTLNGQGADELLAGYSGYPGYRMLSLLSEGHGIAALKFANAWRQWPGRSYQSVVFEFARSLLPDSLYAGLRRTAGKNFTPSWLDTKLLSEAGVRFVEPRYMTDFGPRGRRVMMQLANSLQNRGLPSMLRHGDRNSMAFSIESRVPFLTREFCDLLYSLPESYLISPTGETKSIFRAAMRGIVPDRILDRRDKIGFSTPEKAWISEISPIVRSWLSDAGHIPFLNARNVTKIFDETMSSRRPFNWQVWRLINYIRWWNIL